MDTFRRIVGVVLIVTAVVVAVHTVIEPLYYTSTEASPYSPHWGKINPLMVLAVVLGVIFGYIRKRSVDREGGDAPVTREFLAANTLFYGFLFVGILFFWNWFILLSPAFTAAGGNTASLVWILIDATLPLLAGAMGVFLLRGSRDS
jgi:hypothetical protein